MGLEVTKEALELINQSLCTLKQNFLYDNFETANPTNKVRGLTNVASYTLFSILCLILNREAAQNIKRPDKAVSPTFFNT